MRYRFSKFEVDTEAQRLWVEGEERELGLRAFGVLCLLLQRRGALVSRHDLDPADRRITGRASTEREAASLVAMGQAEVGPGVRAVANEFGLDFVPIGWEAFDLALHRGIFFRKLFQRLLDYLRTPQPFPIPTTPAPTTTLGQGGVCAASVPPRAASCCTITNRC